MVTTGIVHDDGYGWFGFTFGAVRAFGYHSEKQAQICMQRIAAQEGYCKNGHRFGRTPGKVRVCRECRAAMQRRRRAKLRPEHDYPVLLEGPGLSVTIPLSKLLAGA